MIAGIRSGGPREGGAQSINPHPQETRVTRTHVRAGIAAVMLVSDPDFRIAVNRALARIYRNGDVLEIYSRWLGPLGAPGALQIAVYAIEGLPD